MAIVTCGATRSCALRGGFSKRVTWLATERVAERGGFLARRDVHRIMERGVVLEFLGEISHEREGCYYVIKTGGRSKRGERTEEKVWRTGY
jgi:hypothetical protein